MSERSRRILLGVALVGAIIYALNYYVPKLSGQKEPSQAAVQTTTAVSAQPAAMQKQMAVVQISLEEERAKPWGSDPFRSRKPRKVPTKAVGKVVLPWTLTGIVLGGEQPMAIINSRGVSEGDEIDGGRVISIESNRVVLEKAGQTYTLKVKKG